MVALRKGLLGAISALGLLISLSGVAQAATQQASAVSPATKAVKAVLIHPWEGCSPAGGWAELAADASEFGTTRLRIDIKTFCSSSTQVTYAALVASKAQVLVFSDTAGGLYQLSSAEISAITQYVQAGHNIVGTYLTFMWKSTNNSALAPLFGLTSSFAKTAPTVTPDAALSGAKYAAHTANHLAAITTYINKTYHYQAVYISNMPEYSTSSTDLQFLYNALTLKP
jgi:hypothetical protein